MATTTPHLSLTLEPTGAENWTGSVNANFTTLDSAVYTLQTTTGVGSIGPTGATGAQGIQGIPGAVGAVGPSPSGSGNEVLATPSGSSGTAALRALVAADLPSTLNSTTIAGTLGVTGTATVGSGLTASSSGANTWQLAGTNGTAMTALYSGTPAAGAFNVIVRAGDNLLLYTGGALDIAPSGSGGLRMDSSGNMVETGNLTVTGTLSAGSVSYTNLTVTGTTTLATTSATHLTVSGAITGGIGSSFSSALDVTGNLVMGSIASVITNAITSATSGQSVQVNGSGGLTVAGPLILWNSPASAPGTSKTSLSTTTATTATAGSASALPGAPAGYWIVGMGTSLVKIPYWNT